MPIEEVSLEEGECLRLASKQLQREEKWCKQLAIIYPCGLNDNVKNLGNIKKGMKHTVVWSLFQENSQNTPKNRKGNMEPHGQT